MLSDTSDLGGIWPAVTTPFRNDRIDDEVLADTAKLLVDAGCSGIVGTGTMGEAASLTREERRHVIDVLVQAVGDSATVIAGVAGETNVMCAAFIEDAAEVGADAVQCLPPTSYATDPAETEAFFREMAGVSALPLVLYNNPHGSKTDMGPELIASLLKIDGVVAVKECSGDARRIAAILELTEGEGIVFVGGDDWALEGFAAGAVGWISGCATIVPADCVALFAACSSGDIAAARTIYRKLLPLARLDMTPKLVQYYKGAQDRIGRYGGPCRLPRLPLTSLEEALLDDAIAAVTGVAVSERALGRGW